VLDTCPTSNVVLGVFGSFEEHPLPLLRAEGVKVTLGSDDPPYFGATIAGEYEVCAEHMGMSDQDLREITLNAIDAAFCDDALKAELRARV
jgi:adenosine deaminase